MDRKWWTLAAVCVATFMLLLDVTIVNVALPDIQTSLGSSFDDLQWVVDAYALTLASLLLTAGALADLLGRRILFAVGLVLFTLASAACGAAQSPLWLEVSRGVQGIGGAILFATSLALLANAFRGRERGTAFGVWGAITGVAVALGPVIGGALTTALSWRWIFFVNLPVGVVALAITLWKVDESRYREGRRIDWIGFVLFTGSLAALVYALIKSEQLGWGSTTIVACLTGAAVGLVLFLVAERLQRSPMFDLSLFRKPTFAGGAFAAFGLSAALFAMLLYLVLYLQDVLDGSALTTGLRLLYLSGGSLVAAAISGRLSSRVPIRLLIGPGLGLVGLGLLLMRGIEPGDSWTHLIPGFVCAGVGTGLINPPLASTAIGVVPPHQAGMASGINSTFRQVGIATGIGALGSIFQHNLGAGLAAGQSRDAAFISALNDILLVGAVVALTAGVLALVLIRSKDFAEGSQAGPEEGARERSYIQASSAGASSGSEGATASASPSSSTE
jgi:EmrB/QacA subfamily drug resistance transporter